ncbi:GcrA family cell cycle regulator [Nanoarchaeota archaeon]
MNDNMEKGKIAEKLAIQMFKEAGFKVKKSGYENTFKDLADKDNLIKGPAGEYIRHHPDLIIIDRYNNAYLIEVKYRKFGLIYQKDLFYYPETHVILFTRDSIHCQYLKEIHKNGKKFVPLYSMKPFSEISPEIVHKYLLKTRRLLGDDTFFGQMVEGISQKFVGKYFKQTYTPGDVKFSYVEDYTLEGNSYEFTGSEEIISNKKGGNISSRDKKQWGNNEINLLKYYYQSGMSIKDIAGNLGRKKDAVIFRLAKLRLVNIRQANDLVRRKQPNNRKRRYRLRTNKIHAPAHYY